MEWLLVNLVWKCLLASLYDIWVDKCVLWVSCSMFSIASTIGYKSFKFQNFGGQSKMLLKITNILNAYLLPSSCSSSSEYQKNGSLGHSLCSFINMWSITVLSNKQEIHGWRGAFDLPSPLLTRTRPFAFKVLIKEKKLITEDLLRHRGLGTLLSFPL